MRHTWVFAAMLLTASAAVAQDDENNTGFHKHDGFYLRLQLGAGYNHASADSADGDVAIKGVSGGLNLELGYAILENFILYGKLHGTSVTNPDLELNGETFEGDEFDGLASNFSSLGVGATYYFMPVNVYVSAAIATSQLTISQDGDDFVGTDSGPALHLGVGKEWWVSRNWGIGVGGELALARLPDDEDDWNIVNFTIFLSGTFN
jgi:hypothetical protein